MLAGIDLVNGLIENKLNNWDESKDYFEKSIKLFEERGSTSGLGIAQFEYGMANLNRNHHEKAREVLLSASDTYYKMNFKYQIDKIEKIMKGL